MYTQASPQLPKLDEGNIYKTGWWFGTCFVFHNIWDNPSHLIFFRGVETTNQKRSQFCKVKTSGLGFQDCTNGSKMVQCSNHGGYGLHGLQFQIGNLFRRADEAQLVLCPLHLRLIQNDFDSFAVQDGSSINQLPGICTCFFFFNVCFFEANLDSFAMI
jgi:hypothetical protein